MWNEDVVFASIYLPPESVHARFIFFDRQLCQFLTNQAANFAFTCS